MNNNRRLIYNPEINLGHIVTLVGLAGTLVFYAVSYSGEFRVLKEDVNRHGAAIEQHEQQLKTLTEINAKLTTMIEVEKTRFESHIIKP